MKSKKGIAFIAVGLALIICAVSLTAYNKYDEKRAGEVAKAVLGELESEYETVEHDDEPAYMVDSEVEMPTVTVDGYEYIGKIYFPSLDLTLPVISATGEKRLKKAPCRYKGSVYADNMIIGGHNYITHFGRIDNLKYGDTVEFSDMDKNVFTYKVIGTEIIGGNDSNALEAGDWDLTLYTCNMSGRSRITVRCVKLS